MENLKLLQAKKNSIKSSYKCQWDTNQTSQFLLTTHKGHKNHFIPQNNKRSTANRPTSQPTNQPPPGGGSSPNRNSFVKTPSGRHHNQISLCMRRHVYKLQEKLCILPREREGQWALRNVWESISYIRFMPKRRKQVLSNNGKLCRQHTKRTNCAVVFLVLRHREEEA